MRLHQQLRRRLPEISNLILDSFPYQGIGDRVQFHATLVRQVVENIGCAYRLRACEEQSDRARYTRDP